ncbi:MAG: FtsX-like permease family protein, partial [Vicinamibacterales bacterium]
VEEELGLLARSADEKVPGRVTSLVVTNGSLVQHPDMRARAPLLIGLTLGTTTLLLLLACVNVTTLLLSRAAARQREIAVRLSLGAGRFRLLRQLLTESLVLSGLAAALSVLIAQRAPATLWRSVMSTAAPFDLSPDWWVLLYCLCVAVGAGIIAGASPALESLRPGVADSLKRSTTAATHGPRRSRLRGILVAVQVALSLLLLVEAALFTRAQRRFFSYDPGFETTNVVSVRLESVRARYDPPGSFYRELEWRVRAVPGVVTTSYTSLAPWAGRSSSGVTEIDGKPLPDTRDFRRDPARRQVSAEFFEVLGIPLTRGRTFSHHEQRSAAHAIPTIVSEAMARRYWPGQDPVGHQFRTSAGRGRTPWQHDVIGVARDVQSVRYMQDDGPFFYGPLDIEQSNPPAMLIRVSSDPEAVATAIRNLVPLADPQMASTVVTLASIVEAEGERLQPVTMYGAFAGGLALLLALTGVYGVVSFSVTQRIREIGIRVALGAQRRDVLSIVLRSGAAPVVGGLVVGLGLAIAVSFVMEAILFGLSPRDPLTFAGAALLLFAAALGAIWLPARRAAALDPVTSLRYE